MSSLFDDLASFVDARIEANRAKERATGSVAFAEADATNIWVNFDGSNQPSPVKADRNVMAQAGDRVNLVKFGSDWVVVGTFGHSAWDVRYGKSDWAPSATVTSGSYVDFPGPVTFTYTKRFNTTKTEQFIQADMYTFGADSKVLMACRYQALNVDTHIETVQINLNFVTGYGSVGMQGSSLETFSGLASGDYTVTLRWRRFAGTGTPTLDSDRRYSVWVREVSPNSQ